MANINDGLVRLPTGVPGLDTILHGGLLRRSVYIVQGGPGEGKTILANQVCYSAAARGERSLYVTLLAETHHRLLRLIGKMQFLEGEHVNTTVTYESAFDALRKEGLPGVLRFLTRETKRRRPSVIVIDGLFALEESAQTEREFREFVNDIAVFADVVGCTMLLLTNSKRSSGSPEYTMVDGWIELQSAEDEYRTYRYLRVRKFRGSDFAPGRHLTTITDRGYQVFPRLEVLAGRPLPADVEEGAPRVSSGSPSFDEIAGGGLPCSSTTLAVGPPGVGKTSLGLTFICESTVAEPGIIFTFYEDARRLKRRARTLNLDLESLVREGAVEIIQYPPTDHILDQLAEEILEAVRQRGARRLFVDGIDAFEQAAVHKNRMSKFLTALTALLRCEGVTSIFSVELQELIGANEGVNLAAISAIAENMVLLRYVIHASKLHRMLFIIKMRESEFDPHIYEFSIGSDGFRVGQRMQVLEDLASRPPHIPPSERDDV